MQGPEGQSWAPPSPDATPNTDVAVPMKERIKNLPDLGNLPGMDELGKSKDRQDDAEDALFARGAHNPNVAAAEARAAVEAAQGADGPVNMGEAIAATAKSSEGLTFANSPLHAVSLGGPEAITMPTSPAPSRYGSVLEGGQPVANPDDLIGGANNPVPTPDGKPR